MNIVPSVEGIVPSYAPSALAPVAAPPAAGSLHAVPAVRSLPTQAAPSAEAQQSQAGPSYAGMFRSCACGHSSAWHVGAFSDAWRAGIQVRGACEVEGVAGCSCQQFRESAGGF